MRSVGSVRSVRTPRMMIFWDADSSQHVRHHVDPHPDDGGELDEKEEESEDRDHPGLGEGDVDDGMDDPTAHDRQGQRVEPRRFGAGDLRAGIAVVSQLICDSEHCAATINIGPSSSGVIYMIVLEDGAMGASQSTTIDMVETLQSHY